MNTIEFRFSIFKLLLFLFLTSIFVAGGIFILSIADDAGGKLIGWSTIILFGFGCLVLIKQLFTRKPRIIIDDEGIEDKSLGIGKILWKDIESAYPNNITLNKFISLQIRDVEKYLSRTSKPKRKLASYNNALGFETMNLNLVGLAVSQNDLLDQINKYLILSADHKG